MTVLRNILSLLLVALPCFVRTANASEAQGDNIEQAGLSVIDNPVSVVITDNQLKIEINDDKDEHHLTVYAITGQIVKNEQIGSGTTVLDLSRGYYIVKVDNLTKRIVIK